MSRRTLFALAAASSFASPAFAHITVRPDGAHPAPVVNAVTGAHK